ncbi:DUF2007 domain-containing protein [Pseudoxanthomonas sangjuensis]|uniref:putative signal transducing protein n=1 Tax=Pseudoxanthomonas sangjuensis TaxID=1503750 RepID=UPI001390F1B7|nr:DUF2007 domain-containing protein [Pseudoxanthomonas sangjuensis]KAF1713537.1 pathogenicity-like protein [Pseudoxanthomonas sangjuensis]
MRQVFTSQRIETVEGVAKLLGDAGIEVAIRNGRSYQSKRGGQFSYTEPVAANRQPSLWVRRAEDQPRAREILREAGLLDSTRPDQRGNYVFAERDEEAAPHRPWAWRIRIMLLVIIAAVAMFIWLQRKPSPQPAPQPPAEEEMRVRIVPAGQ